MKYALIAATNYENTQNELHGCLQDATNIRNLIEPTGINIYADLRGSDLTTGNWKDALRGVVAKAVAGDVIFSTYSGHGSRARSADGMGMDEIYCPDDFDGTDAHMIRDDFFAALMDELKPDVKFVQFSDCCHAGGSLRDMYNIGERPRYIENEKLFGINFNHTPLNPLVVSGETYKGIGLFACRSNQTSTDCFLDGQSCGAFTHYFLKALSQNPNGNYEDLMLRTTELLGLGGFDQKPEVDCKTGDEHCFFSKDILGA